MYRQEEHVLMGWITGEPKGGNPGGTAWGRELPAVRTDFLRDQLSGHIQACVGSGRAGWGWMPGTKQKPKQKAPGFQ